jgi:pilus assembly protein CpaE
MTDNIEPVNILVPAPIEAEPKIAVGRLPVMAFVADVDSERLLRECLTQLRSNLIMRGGIAKAIEHLGERRSPHLLIVDISGIDLPLSQVHLLADVCEPGTEVIALGDHNDVGLYRDLQDAGVRSYIVKPLTRELLLKTLTPRANPSEIGRSGLKLGKLVSFIGARGGVGATTVACNLAWHLATRQSRRVALVDLDFQHGDCALLLNINYTSGFRDALSNPLRLDQLLLDRIITQYSERLFVLGSEEPLHHHLQFTPTAMDGLFAVLRSQFHYIIADVPRIPAPAYRRALEVADRRVIVVDQTVRSMRDGVRLATMFGGAEPLGTDGTKELRNIFVVNRVGEAGNRLLSLSEINSVLPVQPTSTIPFLPTLITPAAHHGQIASSRRSKFANAIGALALELSGRKERPRWWQRAGK